MQLGEEEEKLIKNKKRSMQAKRETINVTLKQIIYTKV